MKHKTFTLQASGEHARLLAEALNQYAHAAYPPGGSECAQVARQVLLDSAHQINSNAASAHGAQLRSRQRKQIKAAVQWYFSEEGPGDSDLSSAMLRYIP